jgi:hypothetical protein
MEEGSYLEVGADTRVAKEKCENQVQWLRSTSAAMLMSTCIYDIELGELTTRNNKKRITELYYRKPPHIAQIYEVRKDTQSRQSPWKAINQH